MNDVVCFGWYEECFGLDGLIWMFEFVDIVCYCVYYEWGLVYLLMCDFIEFLICFVDIGGD